jgi:hypothetical protein
VRRYSRCSIRNADPTSSTRGQPFQAALRRLDHLSRPGHALMIAQLAAELASLGEHAFQGGSHFGGGITRRAVIHITEQLFQVRQALPCRTEVISPNAEGRLERHG